MQEDNLVCKTIEEDDRKVKEGYLANRANSYDLLYITKAYNTKVISFDEWFDLALKWSGKIIEQYDGKI